MRSFLAFPALLVTACVVANPGPVAPGGPGPAGPGGPGPVAGPVQVGPGANLQPYNGPLACTGTEDLFIENADINVNGPAVAVNGSCTLTIRNSRIVAHGAPAAVVSGSGDMVISNSYVAGQPSLIISGSGTIRATQSQIDGDMFISGSGDMELSGNLIHGRSSVTGTGDVRDGGNQWQ
jgi:hypothetical protein